MAAAGDRTGPDCSDEALWRSGGGKSMLARTARNHSPVSACPIRMHSPNRNTWVRC